MDNLDEFLEASGIHSHERLHPKAHRDHAVIVEFFHGIDALDEIHALELELEKVVENAGVGRLDGHEVAMDNTDGRLYLYGPNAEALFKAIKPILEGSHLMKGAWANLRFGPPDEDVPEIDIEI